ncbi:unnamed protein product [Agarophyton chilense]
MPSQLPRSQAAPHPSSLIPKDVTRVSSLIESTGVDGSGITVAVLDTGVDPGAPGLLDTTTNQRKIVDIVDCTASGDVVTTASVTLQPSVNTINALSGRVLTIPQHILDLNPSRVFKLGVKQGYQLFPNTLISRLKKERRSVWDKHIRAALNHVRQQLYKQRESKNAQPSAEELEARQAVLLSMDKAYVDYGPLYDVLVFYDGSRWRVVVDTSGKGNLDHCDILEDFAVHGNYSQFEGGIMMNFGVNVYEDGNLVSIVVDGGSHGTHVTGILAAHFPDSPHLNGLAPGARIVSLKIGDSRLSSMETHQGAMRALAYVLKHSVPLRNEPRREGSKGSLSGDGVQKTSTGTSKESEESNSTTAPLETVVESSDPIRIDVCNMSFGEHSRDVNRGRFVSLVETLVHKHNVLFLSSAGNEGPGLSSVSAPGGTTDAIIGVGAYVTPPMLTQAYSLLHSEFGDRETNSGFVDEGRGRREGNLTKDSSCVREPEAVVALPYTWSSRGPTWDGAMGVSICSPGGAIAPVPLWMLRKKMLLNGTSMSSPSAAGAVAVVLSFLKNRGIPYTSALVRRALENTARPLKSPSYSLDPNARHVTAESRVEEHKSNFDSEYYHDIVFAAGHGSVDALAACQYIESYMSSRSMIGDSDIQSTFQNRTRAAEAVATSLLEVSDSAREKHQEKKNANGSTTEEHRVYYSTHENCGNSSLCLQDWWIKVRVEDGSPARKSSSNPGFGALNTTRGIYLRGEAQTKSVHKASISIEMVPRDEENIETKKALADMEVTISLHCSASWVEVPSTMILLGAGRSFSACIDPTKLTPGRAHFAEVVGKVFGGAERQGHGGPVFRVPIAIHKPEPLFDGVTIKPLRDLSFSPGSVIRRFYDAPIGATYALLRINTGTLSLPGEPSTTGFHSSIQGRINEEASAIEFSELSSNPSQPDELGGFPLVKRNRARSMGDQRSDTNKMKMDVHKKTKSESSDITQTKISTRSRITGTADARSFEVHVVQLGPRKHCGELESRQYCTLRPGMVKEFIIQVKGGCTMELCLAQLWSSPGGSIIESVDLAFGGLLPNPSSICASLGAFCFPHVEVTNFLQDPISHVRGVGYISGYAPRGTLSKLQRVLAPLSSKLKALAERDILPEKGIMFQLELQYEFEVYDSSCSVRLLFPGLNGAVYEAEVEGGPYVTIHDRNKQFMFASDIYPREMSLGNGEYSATAYLRHDKVDVLERLRDLGMTVQYELPNAISLDAFDTSHAAILGIDDRRSSKATTTLECGERRAFYFAVPKKSSLPKWANVGDLAVGQMSIDKVLSASSSSSRRGNYVPSYPVQLFIGTSPSSSTGENKASREKNKVKASSDGSVRNGDESSDHTEGSEVKPNKIDEGPDKWIEDAARKLRLKRLRLFLKENKFQAFDALFASFLDKYQEDPEFLLLNLERHDVNAAKLYRTEGLTGGFREAVERIEQVADAVCRILNPSAVAAHFGMMVDTENPDEVSRRKQFESKRSQLIEASFRKARALCLRSLPYQSSLAGQVMDRTDQGSGGNGQCHDTSSSPNENGKKSMHADGCEQAFKDLIRWVTLDGKGSLPGSSKSEVCDGSTTSEDLALLGALREVRRGQLGFALRILDTYFGSGSSKKPEAQSIVRFREALFRKLRWTYLADRERVYARVRFPMHVTPF